MELGLVLLQWDLMSSLKFYGYYPGSLKSFKSVCDTFEP